MSQALTPPKPLVSHLKTAMETLRPPPRLSVSEWADQRRRLDSQSSAEPGRCVARRIRWFAFVQRPQIRVCCAPQASDDPLPPAPLSLSIGVSHKIFVTTGTRNEPAKGRLVSDTA